MTVAAKDHSLPLRDYALQNNSVRHIAIGALTVFLSATNVVADESLEQFLAFQKAAAIEANVNAESTSTFYKHSFEFWIPHAVDYNANPEKYREIISLYHQNQAKYPRDGTINLDRYADTIEQYRRFDKRNLLPSDPVLFVGSSSIVYWETSVSFPGYPVINRGFGGASLPEVIHFYDDVIKKHAPSVVVVYCDIDVENGKSPEFSVQAFKQLVNRISEDFPTTNIVFLSMKPTLIDDVLGKQVRENKIMTNNLLADYSDSKDNLHYVDVSRVMFADDTGLKDEIFLDDGMHLNALGYELWNPIVKAKIDQIIDQR